jgi:hypothetical protein
MANDDRSTRGRKPPRSAWTAARPDKRGAPPALLADVLVGAENFIAKRSGAAIPRAQWTTIVGPRIAGRTRVGGLFKNVLTVKVASSAWSNELSFLKVDLIAKLQRAGYDVTDLRFRLDRIEETKAPMRRGPSQAAPTTGQTPLPPELLERLQKVDDPNLRAAIAEAARYSFRDKKR